MHGPAVRDHVSVELMCINAPGIHSGNKGVVRPPKIEAHPLCCAGGLAYANALGEVRYAIGFMRFDMCDMPQAAQLHYW